MGIIDREVKEMTETSLSFYKIKLKLKSKNYEEDFLCDRSFRYDDSCYVFMWKQGCC